MPIAISAWFDQQTEDSVREVWRQLAESGVFSEFHDGPFRPHITLSAYVNLEVDSCVACLRDFLCTTPPLSVSLYSLGQFLLPTGAIYISSLINEPLLAFRREIARRLSSFGSVLFLPYYEPDRWVPHVSLARGLTPQQLLAAFEICQKIPLPISAQVNRVGIIEFPIERELYELFLKGKDA